MRRKAWTLKEPVMEGLLAEVLAATDCWLQANRRRQTNPSISWEQQKLGISASVPY